METPLRSLAKKRITPQKKVRIKFSIENIHELHLVVVYSIYIIIMRDLSSVKVTPGRQIPRLKERKEKKKTIFCVFPGYSYFSTSVTHSSSIQITTQEFI